MASFSIMDADRTWDSVNVEISGLVAGNTYRIIIRLKDDPADQTVFVSYEAKDASVIRSFDVLQHSTEYAVNVDPGDGTGWIGAQYFATTAPPAVYVDKIYSLPALNSNYPLFDWSSWPNSYNALVSGGGVSSFEKACWNAIVEKLSETLEAVGDGWSHKDGVYTKEEDTLMEISDIFNYPEPLSAEMFNSVRYNINRLVPFPWAWARRPSFRGYVGREDFRGVNSHGEKLADSVYPEYLKELVRRLNLLIEILRGTADFSYVSSREQNLTDYEARGLTRLAAALSMDVYAMETQYDAMLRQGLAVRSSYIESLSTNYECGARSNRGTRLMLRNFYDTNSSYECMMYAARFLRITISADEHSTSRSVSSVNSGISLPTSGVGSSMSNSNITVFSAFPAYIEAEAPSVSGSEVTANVAPSAAIVAPGKAETDHECEPVSSKAANIKAESESTTSIVVAALDTAWYPPEWVDGGLWLRQSHSVIQNNDGSLEVT